MSIILNCAACNKALPYNAKRCAACTDHDQTLNLRKMYAESLYLTDAASRDDVAKATTILEDVARTARRRPSCKYTEAIHASLETAREKLASLQNKRRRSTRTQAALEAAVLAM